MSVVVWKWPGLSTGPRLWTENGQLLARTPALLRCLSGLAFDVRLRIDRSTQYLILERRSWWFVRRSRAIPFRQIEHIAYRFWSFGTDWAWGRRADQFEVMSVGLVLKGRETVHLFSFLGEGSVATGWGGTLMGDSLVDVRGDQVESSRRFVDQLAAVLGVGLSAPTPRVRKDALGRVWACASCQRVGPPRRGRCVFCGGELAARP